MEYTFSGKTVVITGASDGIGLETAKLFAQAGANVAICGRNEEKLNQAKKMLDAYGTIIYTEACDVASSEQLRQFAEHAESALGGINVFINNAGYMPFSNLNDMTDRLWDQVIDTNLKSVFVGTQAAFKSMKTHGGVIINASSFAAVMPSVGLSAYAAAKAGVMSLTKCYASELAPYGIRVLGYIPGLINTALNKENIAKNQDKLQEPISLHRYGNPEEIASAILFMASDAASYITGTCLEITGGKFSTQNPATAWT